MERIAELRELLGDEDKVLELIKEELSEIAERFGDDRRTQIADSEDEIDIEDLIREQQMVVTITHSGYIKSLPLDTYRQQHRGGRGVTGMDTKEGDYIEHLFVCSSHDYLLFFSNRGKVYRSKVYELPEMGRTARGRALVNFLPLREGERIQSVLSTRDFTEGKYLVFATRNGIGRRRPSSSPTTRRSRPTASSPSTSATTTSSSPCAGRRATTRSSWSPARARPCASTRTRCGRWAATPRACAAWTSRARTTRCSRWTSRATTRSCSSSPSNGYGKRTPIDQYRKTNRGAKGVGTIKLTEAKGALAGALVVREHEDLVFISQQRHGPAHRRARHLAATAGSRRACGS